MSKKNKKRVVVGGTFDILHKGHKTLLRKAFSLGETLIGVTSDKLAGKSRIRKVRPFRERERGLEEFIAKESFKKAKIAKIEDEFGPTLEEDFDYIVVSPGTYKTAALINKEREKLGKKPIKIVVINFVLDKDGKILSATKILENKKVVSK
ncbi:MAG: pantetheine-phosphate adenylyltransferase [Candidatus Omnitrophota bacterium]